jgi:hypothetical protein
MSGSSLIAVNALSLKRLRLPLAPAPAAAGDATGIEHNNHMYHPV